MVGTPFEHRHQIYPRPFVSELGQTNPIESLNGACMSAAKIRGSELDGDHHRD